MDDIPSECRVVPFGNLWIKGYLHLPRAYRSLSRPSSPPRAKASAMRPCLLSFKLTFKYQVSSIRYYPGILNIAVLKTYGSIYTFSSLLNFTFCTSCQRSFLCFQRWWRITDSNRWPSACKADALASWAIGLVQPCLPDVRLGFFISLVYLYLYFYRWLIYML